MVFSIDYQELRVKELNNECFQFYGKVVTIPEDTADGIEKEFNWWGNVADLPANGQINTGLLQVKHRDFLVEKVEYHRETAEMLIPLKGNSILVVGRKADDSEKIECIDAFYFNKSKVVIMDKETLHWIPFPLGKDAVYAVIFRAETPNDDLSFMEFKQPLEITL